ncbi:Methylthioribose-1-phosphate isomerase [Piedraia hortae CBS 480.64]|uniref:Methylthioribose-1-phosphate isomerase n=1 Tax=Piedraia hortae CBS 480.64 TaxID=1314780 RepID=A0A6A7C317_9PEZI|nr:Methylthioribose-1-phosphate isomerase [Piedraia hortae CBS 480.64]
MTLEAISYQPGSLQILDQLLLHHKSNYISIRTAEDAHNAISKMQVRGAPAIAIVAVLSLAVELHNNKDNFPQSAQAMADFVNQKLNYLLTSRPTAVNLSNAVRELAAQPYPNATSEDVVKEYTNRAEEIFRADLSTNKSLSSHGTEWLCKASLSPRRLNILTHCNTGSLATSGWGTALGVVRSLHSRGALERVYFTETRPYNQGARLTAYEVLSDQLPGMLIPDSAVASLLRSRQIDAVIVGADRIARNGDTANKIGTYGIAIAARYHGVKFLVAAPLSTVDWELEGGEQIKIEERAAEEFVKLGDVRLAPEGTEAWNPAFDVTPAALIDGIVTEEGIVERDGDRFNLKAFRRRVERERKRM